MNVLSNLSQRFDYMFPICFRFLRHSFLAIYLGFLFIRPFSLILPLNAQSCVNLPSCLVFHWTFPQLDWSFPPIFLIYLFSIVTTLLFFLLAHLNLERAFEEFHIFTQNEVGKYRWSFSNNFLFPPLIFLKPFLLQLSFRLVNPEFEFLSFLSWFIYFLIHALNLS